MKRRLFAIGVLVFAACLRGDEIKMRVIDETGTPVSGAHAQIDFASAVNGANDSHAVLTGPDGVLRATGRAQHSVLVQADKAGYYPARIELERHRDFDLTIVLPRIIRPIPLFAKRGAVMVAELNSDEHPSRKKLINDDLLGYDFEIGDMVAPNGKGQVTDILFKIHSEFKGWRYSDDEMKEMRERPNARNKTEEELRVRMGKWDCTLEISFPEAQDGLIEVKDNFVPYSRLKMPQSAPTDGYRPTWRYTSNNYSPLAARDDAGFFLRTRVKLDKDSRIVSANYTKIMGDFLAVPTGAVRFTYYFNPTPNDRNLEFDLSRNLFTNLKAGEGVATP